MSMETEFPKTWDLTKAADCREFLIMVRAKEKLKGPDVGSIESWPDERVISVAQDCARKAGLSFLEVN
jgi:hypothetical protein